MALIVEDGSGLNNSNSYVSLEDCEKYFNERELSSCSIYEGHLISATEFIDVTYGQYFLGQKSKDNQALMYPRTSFYANNGDYIEANTIPNNLKIATYQAAKLIADGIELNMGDPDDKLSSLSQSVDGAVSQSKTWFSPVARSKNKIIGKYLSSLLDGAIGNRTVRA